LSEDPKGLLAGIAGNDAGPLEANGLLAVLLKGFATAVDDAPPNGLTVAAEGVVVVGPTDVLDAVDAIPLLAPNENGPPEPKVKAGGGNDFDDEDP